ncbi:MAG: VWA domain-containing protein [Acidimicrobiales bacterium]|nr:VWA domain-containing protein [Acidimicrobiales bacterium]
MTGFTAEVFQNEYLAAGANVVDAVVTVRATEAGGEATDPSDAVEVIVIDCSGSMREERGAKMRSAITATMAAVDHIRDGVMFAVIAGIDGAYTIYPQQPGLVRADARTREEAKAAVSQVRAKGGTAIGTWLRSAAALFESYPSSINHCILLTDGKNQSETSRQLDEAIATCMGLFQCDARGLGTDWNVEELRRVANALLGTVDIIPRPEDMEAEFKALTEAAMGKEVGNVALRLWTPKGSQIEFLKQVAPSLDELSGKAQPVDELTADYPLGAWAKDEERDYHLRIRIPPGNVGDERLAARVALAINNQAQPAALVRAVWTSDSALSTRLNREVAHYTGQAELADAIAEGLAARSSGDEATATVKLGRAVQLAHEAGNDDTVKLLGKVVDVDDPETGTVRLKGRVETADEMALDVRSTRTVRVNRGG